MARKISDETIKGIIELLSSDLKDAEIANKYGVSGSYVNKIRNRHLKNPEQYKHLFNETKTTTKETTTKETTKEFIKEIVLTGDIDVNEIELIQMKINSLELTIKWYKELLSMKKKKK